LIIYLSKQHARARACVCVCVCACARARAIGLVFKIFYIKSALCLKTVHFI